MSQQVIFTLDPGTALTQALAHGGHHNVGVLVDEHTAVDVLPRLHAVADSATVITIPAGEAAKTIISVRQVWEALQQARFTRHDVLVNVGGGMVTDLGGFAAATFKRGIPFINVPTTLLGAVDAAIGGKTGVNLDGVKNAVGAFAEAASVIVSTRFFDTLPAEQLLSGYGEMLKHGLLSGPLALAALLDTDPVAGDADALLDRVRESVAVKQRIVEQDPHEHGLRKALNLGHTVGHALESHLLNRGTAVPHGIAVAWGLVAELVLSHLTWGFPSATLHQVATVVREHYPVPDITCDDYDGLLALMRHDKKNRDSSEINCTLLHDTGQPAIDNAIAPGDMRTALDITRDLLGI